MDVVHILQSVCRKSSSSGELLRARSYKLDQVAHWAAWASQLQVKLRYITGPGAPHMLKFVRRGDLGMPLKLEHGHCGVAELGCEIDDLPQRFPRRADDIMLVVKHHMADKAPSQVLALVPASTTNRLLEGVLQPRGVVARRPKTRPLVENIHREVPKLMRQRFLTEEAAAYLLAYVDGRLPQEPRPQSYAFLDHRWDHDRSHMARVTDYDGDNHPLNRVRVVNLRQVPRRLRGGLEDCAAGQADQSGDDGDPGPLDLVPGALA